MSDESVVETKHTPLVVGGVYERTHFDGKLMRGLMAGAVIHPSGRQEGRIITEFAGVEYVNYGTSELDRWTIVAEPYQLVAMAERDRKLNEAVMAIESLRLEISRLQSPTQDTVASPAAVLTETQKRGSRLVPPPGGS